MSFNARLITLCDLDPRDDHDIVVTLDAMLAQRNWTLTQLSEATGITLANLSNLKNGKARAVRFTSLSAICRALECEPGDILTRQ